MKIDTKRFKRLESDEHSTTLQHDDGHILTVAHKGLSPKMRGQIAELASVEAKPDESKAAQSLPKSPEDRLNANEYRASVGHRTRTGKVDAIP